MYIDLIATHAKPARHCAFLLHTLNPIEINEGFGHARGVLGDLEMLSDEVENNVDLTWELVQQKLSDFFEPAAAEGEE